MKAKEIPGVPQQKKGSFHDTESQKYFENSSAAAQQFEILKKRFLNISQWKEYCGGNLADFKLYDSYGYFIERDPQIGDFIKIDIPGPGDTEAKGYDWVKIISIFSEKNDNYERILISCSPSIVPGEPKDYHIAHFYSAEATSNFMILRQDNCITTAVYGRNESPNFKTTSVNITRNIFIAIGGMMGASKIQWKSLTDGLLDF
ncbi:MULTISPECIES: hypothetical protein [Chryseobacterium]|uniref:Uncharacterized protein n=1 Tax=Chryseobacterium geocarposphaerae TaxID=1416776 RepID=A0ABU1LAG6_9FLAO|nr:MULTISPECIES: hypothetical protein [Chryseobacterium]MDR6403707.1 hypothetical protein [Chryseobacterium geocarposphaerae]MDR6697261.1 hypothetical protein [Chryseobacterium ginsenosidimutans]